MTLGRLVSIHIAPTAKAPMQAVSSIRAIPGKGLEGDRYSLGAGTFSNWPGTGREVTLIAAEAVESLEREHGVHLEPGEARRNLVTRGVALNDLVGRVFRIGQTRLRGMRLAEPCKNLEETTQKKLLPGLVHQGGLRAEFLDEGELRVGDEVQITD
jgi:MOSC domain-containing protein YiiM